MRLALGQSLLQWYQVQCCLELIIKCVNNPPAHPNTHTCSLLYSCHSSSAQKTPWDFSPLLDSSRTHSCSCRPKQRPKVKQDEWQHLPLTHSRHPVVISFKTRGRRITLTFCIFYNTDRAVEGGGRREGVWGMRTSVLNSFISKEQKWVKLYTIKEVNKRIIIIKNASFYHSTDSLRGGEHLSPPVLILCSCDDLHQPLHHHLHRHHCHRDPQLFSLVPQLTCCTWRRIWENMKTTLLTLRYTGTVLVWWCGLSCDLEVVNWLQTHPAVTQHWQRENQQMLLTSALCSDPPDPCSGSGSRCETDSDVCWGETLTQSETQSAVITVGHVSIRNLKLSFHTENHCSLGHLLTSTSRSRLPTSWCCCSSRIAASCSCWPSSTFGLFTTRPAEKTTKYVTLVLC